MRSLSFSIKLSAIVITAVILLMIIKETGLYKNELPVDQSLTILIYILLLICLLLSMSMAQKVRQHKIPIKSNNEESLEKSKRDVQLFINEVKDYAIFLLDKNGRVASWNSGAEKIKGYSSDEIIDQSIERFYSPEEIEQGEPMKNLQMAYEHGRYETEGWRVRKNGTRFFANVVFTSLRDEHNDFYGYVKITRDITERKKAEKESGLLSRLINQSNDAIYTLDVDLTVKSWNKGAENLYGFSASEIIGKNPNEVLQTSISEREIGIVLKEILDEDYWTGEIKRKTKDDRSIYVHASSSTIKDEDGTITGYVSVGFDITIQKQLQDEVNYLASLVEQSSEAIFSRGPDKRIVSWNGGAEKMFGISRQQAIGKTAKELGFIKLTDEELTVIETQVARAGVWKSEMDYLRPDGSSFFGSVTANAIKNEPGHITALSFIIKDLSLRKQLEEQLKRSNEELEEKVRVRTEAIISAEKQFRHTLDNMMEGIQIHDFNWRYTYVNNALAGYSKSTKEKLLGNTLHDVYPGIGETNLFKTLERCMTERIADHFETEFTFPDNTSAYFELSIQPVPEGLFILSIDITRRKKIEEELIKSEENYRTIMERVSDAFVAIDKDWHYTYANKKACEVMNKRPSELMGKNIWSEFPDAQGNPFHNAYKKAFGEQRYIYLQEYYPPFRVWLENHIYPSPDGLSIFFRDITEKKLAEQQQEFDHNNLHALINNTQDMMWSVNRDFKLITSNQAFDEMVKIISGKKAEKGEDILRTAINNEQLQHYKNYYERAFAGEAFMVTQLNESPVEFWSELSFYPIYEKKEVIGTACFSRNITDRKKAEELLQNSFAEKQVLAERLSSILNTLPANIALVDKTGFIIDVNDSWKRFADENGFIGKNYCVGDNYISIAGNSQGQQMADGKIVANGLQQVLFHNKPEFEFEYACHSETTKRWFRMIVTPLMKKEYTGAVVMHIDISDLRRLEKERLESKIQEQKKITRAMLNAQQKERSAIGTELHDNVNQILVGTNLMLSMVKRRPENIEELIETSMANLQMAIRENRKIAHEFVGPDLETETLEDQLKKLTQTMLEASGITVLFDTTGFWEDLLDSEKKLNIYRIAQEQITNIVKHSGATSVTIQLLTADGLFRMSIADNGNGMDSADKLKGIGLRNIKDRLSLFNGNVKIKTAKNSGFTLTVTIPCSK
ncbi:MAG: PAS domain S-box protein [Chitinophagaceae bacterium]